LIDYSLHRDKPRCEQRNYAAPESEVLSMHVPPEKKSGTY